MTKMKSSNFSYRRQFLNHKSSIWWLKNIDFFAKWLSISGSNLQMWIRRNFKHLDKYDESIKHKLKEKRIKNKRYWKPLDINKRRWVTVCQMVGSINNWIKRMQTIKLTIMRLLLSQKCYELRMGKES